MIYLHLGTRDPRTIWKCPGKCMLILMDMCMSLLLIRIWRYILLSDCHRALDYHLILLPPPQSLQHHVSGNLCSLKSSLCWPDSLPSFWHPKVCGRAGSPWGFLPQGTFSLGTPRFVQQFLPHLALPGHRTQPLSQSGFTKGAPLITFPDSSSPYWWFGVSGEGSFEKPSLCVFLAPPHPLLIHFLCTYQRSGFFYSGGGGSFEVLNLYPWCLSRYFPKENGI